MTEGDSSSHFSRVVAIATPIFRSRAAVVEWMRTPLPALGGATPQSILNTDAGADRVVVILGAIEHGVFV